MAWLVSAGRVLASAEVADSRRAKGRGLLKRDGIDGAMVIPGCKWVHSLGMRFDLDVAYLNDLDVVIKIHHLARHRIGPPVRNAHTVVEAEAGAFARWGLLIGDIVEVRE